MNIFSLFFYIAFICIFVYGLSVKKSLLNSCCVNHTKAELLYSCINNANQATLPKSIMSPELLNVILLTFLTKNILPYAAYAVAINSYYSHLHNYRFIAHETEHMHDSSILDHYDVRWNKIRLLFDYLNSTHISSFDFIMWVDADLIIMNMNFSIQSIISRNPEAHMIISAEFAGSTTMINSGSILVKNSLWSRQFLWNWWTFADRRLFSDQEQFDMLYQHLLRQHQNASQILRKRIVILPPKAMNSNPPAMTEQQGDHQVLHLMGEEMAFRTTVFRTGWEHICDSIYYNNISLHQQLTLTQSFLLQTTVEEYGPLAVSHLTTLESSSSSADSNFTVQTLSFCRMVSNTVHHYTHALDYIDHQPQQQQQPILVGSSQSLRVRLYTALKHQLTLWQEHQTKHIDYPEMIKTVAIAGQHLLHDLSLPLQQRAATAEELEFYLQQMYSLADPQQRPAILHMVIHLHQLQGSMAIENQNVLLAKEYFEESLKIARELITSSGEHVLISPLSMLANVEAMRGNHVRAQELFEEAIVIATQHLGSSHISLAQLYLNCGLSQHERQDANYVKLAVELWRKAMGVLRANKADNQENEVYRRLLEYLPSL